MDAELVVIGAGVMGTAVALELTRRGHDVVVVEQFQQGHARGSSHGATRIFRFSYQKPAYVAMAVEALRDWRRLERDSGATLIETTGGVDLGEGAPLCAAAMTEAGVDFEELNRKDLLDRLDLKLGADYAVFQKNGGVIAAAEALAAQTGLATLAGADFHYGAKVVAVAADGEGGLVALEDGELRAERVVMSAGGWTKPLALTARIDLPLEVTKQQIAYFSIDRDLPVVIEWSDPARYLVPHRFSAPGIKVGLHHHGELVDPNDGPFEPTDAGVEDVTQWIEALTGESPTLLGRETCLYTNSPDEDFVLAIDGPILIVSACSGHGFKFGPRMGRGVADLIEGKDPGILEDFIRRDGVTA